MENGIPEDEEIVIPKSKVNWKKEILKMASVGVTALAGLGLLLYVQTSLLTVLTSVFGIAAVAWLTERDTRGPSRIPPGGKTVLVTGCDTGPAQMLIKHLDGLGVTVFACMADVTSHAAQCLGAQCSARLRLIELDVRREKEVTQCAEALRTLLKGFTRKSLWGLIVFTGAISDEVDEKEDSDPLEVFRANTELNQSGSISVLHSFASVMRPFGGRMLHVDLDARIHKSGENPAYSVVMSAVDTFLTIVRREVADLQMYVISVKYLGDRLKIGTRKQSLSTDTSNDGDTSQKQQEHQDTANEEPNVANDESSQGEKEESQLLPSSPQKLPTKDSALLYHDLVEKTTNALFDLNPKIQYKAGQPSFFGIFSLGRA